MHVNGLVFIYHGTSVASTVSRGLAARQKAATPSVVTGKAYYSEHAEAPTTKWVASMKKRTPDELNIDVWWYGFVRPVVK